MWVTTESGRRLLKAFLVAPLAPSGVIMLISLIGKAGEGIWLCLFVLPLSYAALVFPGIPLYLLIRMLRCRSVWAYAFAGVVSSFAAPVAFSWGTFADKVADGGLAVWQPFIALSIVASILGCIAGIVFWRIARPDHDRAEVGTLPPPPSDAR